MHMFTVTSQYGKKKPTYNSKLSYMAEVFKYLLPPKSVMKTQ